MRLREFSRGSAGQQPVVVCAPYALHGALIADFATSHSLVEALQKDGVNRIYVPDWRSASPEMRYLSIDNYLADLNVAIDEIGAPVDLVGLCQGGWLSLVYAARFPGKVRRLVLAGAPVDISTPSELSKMVAAFRSQLSSRWCSRATASSAASICLSSGTFRSASMTWKPCCNGISAMDRTRRGGCWIVSSAGTARRWICRDLLSRSDRPGFPAEPDREGRFVALGRRIDLAEVRVPVFLLAGADDIVVPARSGVRHRTAVGHAAGVAGTGLRAVRSPQPFHGAQAPWPFLAPDRPVASGRHRRCRRRRISA
jgi:pimeloyl-ACP methyl ester carboxylesterase